MTTNKLEKQTYALQSIETEYRGATNTRGSRIVVKTCSGIKKSFPWDCELNEYNNHKQAAIDVLKELGWYDRPWIAGASNNGKGYIFVCEPKM